MCFIGWVSKAVLAVLSACWCPSAESTVLSLGSLKIPRYYPLTMSQKEQSQYPWWAPLSRLLWHPGCTAYIIPKMGIRFEWVLKLIGIVLCWYGRKSVDPCSRRPQHIRDILNPGPYPFHISRRLDGLFHRFYPMGSCRVVSWDDPATTSNYRDCDWSQLVRLFLLHCTAVCGFIA